MGCSRFWCLLAFRQAAYFWQYLKAKMVPTERFELSTSPLPRECSTPELCGRRERRDIATGAGPNSSFAGAALTAGRASREHGPWPPRASPHPPPVFCINLLINNNFFRYALHLPIKQPICRTALLTENWLKFGILANGLGLGRAG